MKCKHCGKAIEQWAATGVWYHRSSCETFCDKQKMLTSATWTNAEPENES